MRAGGGVGIGILAERVSMVIKSPPGVGGGSELSVRPRLGACGEARTDGRERGEGWGQGRRYAHGAELKRTTRAPYFVRHEQNREQRGGRLALRSHYAYMII